MTLSVPAAQAMKAFSTFMLLEQQLLKHSSRGNALIRCFLEMFQVYQPRRLHKLLTGNVQMYMELASLGQPGCQCPLRLRPGVNICPAAGLPLGESVPAQGTDTKTVAQTYLEFLSMITWKKPQGTYDLMPALNITSW